MEQKEKEIIRYEIDETISTIKSLYDSIDTIAAMAKTITGALKNNKKLIIFGNGGSAADAQHIAGEFIGRFALDRKPLPAIALTTDTSVITAIGNDYGFKEIFTRQVDALCNDGDVVLAISTSGFSENVCFAVDKAKKKGAAILGLTSESGGSLGLQCDLSIFVQGWRSSKIQEAHITIGHVICGLVEKAMFDEHLEEAYNEQKRNSEE